MKLHEIIQHMENKESVRLDLCEPYKRLLKRYYCAYYGNFEFIMIVTDVFNIGGYGFISSSDAYTEDVEEYVNSIPDLTEEDREAAKEVIGVNSFALNNW